MRDRRRAQDKHEGKQRDKGPPHDAPSDPVGFHRHPANPHSSVDTWRLRTVRPFTRPDRRRSSLFLEPRSQRKSHIYGPPDGRPAMDRRKILLLIFDGLGDRPIPELARQTPLQTARKEHLDWFAANGVNGLMDPIAPGVEPGSDTSHLALAPAPEAPQLEGGVRVLFRAGTEHRAALVLRGASLSPHVTDSDPHEEGAVVASGAATESNGGATAHAVNAFTRECFRILKDHPINMERAKAGLPPANMVLLRGAGS